MTQHSCTAPAGMPQHSAGQQQYSAGVQQLHGSSQQQYSASQRLARDSPPIRDPSPPEAATHHRREAASQLKKAAQAVAADADSSGWSIGAVSPRSRGAATPRQQPLTQKVALPVPQSTTSADSQPIIQDLDHLPNPLLPRGHQPAAQGTARAGSPADSDSSAQSRSTHASAVSAAAAGSPPRTTEPQAMSPVRVASAYGPASPHRAGSAQGDTALSSDRAGTVWRAGSPEGSPDRPQVQHGQHACDQGAQSAHAAMANCKPPIHEPLQPHTRNASNACRDCVPITQLSPLMQCEMSIRMLRYTVSGRACMSLSMPCQQAL